MATNDTPAWLPVSQSIVNRKHLTGVSASSTVQGDKRGETKFADDMLTRIQRIRRDVPSTAKELIIQDVSVFGRFAKWFAGSCITAFTRAHAYNMSGPKAPWPRKKNITTIVVHGTAGGSELSDLVKWVYGAAGTAAGPSYNMASGNEFGIMFHYGIGNDGTVGQFIPDDYWNYHSTSGDLDEETIGIEMVMPSNSFNAPSRAQFDSLIRLIVYLCEQYPSITLVDSHSRREWVYTCQSNPAYPNKDCPGMPFVNTYMNYGIYGGWQYSEMYKMLKYFNLDSTATFDLPSYPRPGEGHTHDIVFGEEDPTEIPTVFTGLRSRFLIELIREAEFGGTT